MCRPSAFHNHEAWSLPSASVRDAVPRFCLSHETFAYVYANDKNRFHDVFLGGRAGGVPETVLG